MGTLFIQEYEQMSRDPSGHMIPVGNEPAIASQAITTNAATPVQSAALQATTRFVRLVASDDMHVAFGADPTADTDAMALEASQAEYFGVRKSGLKISAIEGTL